MPLHIVSQAVVLAAMGHRRNCVRDYLDSLRWDGVLRVDRFFTDRFDADGPRQYLASASGNFFKSAVARIYQPGCKVDNMTVLEGDQGIGKSSALEVLGGSWFTEQHESASNPKGFAEILQGKWIVEIGEMDAFSRSEVSRVKQTVSCVSDRFRPAYARHAADHPRRCVFIGTTNRNDWNRDETGARRFWPIACRGAIDLASIRADRDQLFAEAVSRFHRGESWWVMPSAETKAQQDERYIEDAWHDQIADFVALKTEVTINEILADCLKVDLGRAERSLQMRVGAVLRRLHWEKKNVRNTRDWKAVRKAWRRKNDVAL